jgi:hypothetical protein
VLSFVKRLIGIGMPEPIRVLRRQVASVAHPQYPFLHPTYSPSSRVPCSDFTGFIAGRLQVRDFRSVFYLMREIIKANPGLGTDSSWIEEEITKLLSIDFNRYVRFQPPEALYEFLAMVIVAAKEGGGREFWVGDDCKFPLFFAQALSAHGVAIGPDTERLIPKANKWLREITKETAEAGSSYWTSFELFSKGDLTVYSPPESATRARLRAMSVGARLHLFEAMAIGFGSLPQLPSCKLRNYGLDVAASTAEILNSGLVCHSSDYSKLPTGVSKSELFELCERHGVQTRKSWNAQRLFGVLQSQSPSALVNLTQAKDIVSANPEHYAALNHIQQCAAANRRFFQILCFAA